MTTDLQRLRVLSLMEGLSYILLTVAMPLKYLFAIPIAVKITGMLHGILCLGLILAILKAQFQYKWKSSFSILIFLASLLPLGAFFMDHQLKALQQINSIARRHHRATGIKNISSPCLA